MYDLVGNPCVIMLCSLFWCIFEFFELFLNLWICAFGRDYVLNEMNWVKDDASLVFLLELS